MVWTNSPSTWNQFIGALSPTGGEKVLDLGAGKGAVAAKVHDASNGAEVYAIDPSIRKVSSLRQEFPALQGSVAVAENLPFRDSLFDKAYTTLALHHFVDLDASLHEVARTLRQGGKFVILEVDPRSSSGRLFRLFGRLMGEHLNLMSEPELLAKLAGAEGFTVAASTKLQGSNYLIQLARR